MIKLNFFNSLKDNYIKNGLKLEDIETSQYEQQLKSIILNKSRDMMDWIDLPYEGKSFFEETQTYGKHIRNHYENFIVLGIGGSALGAKAIKQALYPYNSGKINVTIFDNIDAENFYSIIESVNLEKTMFNVVTKSGTTVEILTMFVIVLEKLKTLMGEKASLNLVVTTEKNNALWNFCQENNIKTYEIPKGVGGRYSVLCPVGLLPSAVMGINLEKLLWGAKQVLENFKQQDLSKNICYVSALINYSYFLRGKTEMVLLPYSNRLSEMADFYIQLLSESLGKEKLLNGQPNTIFFTPTKAEGVTYQHSLLQMFQEGKQNKLFCFINLEKPVRDIEVPRFETKSLDKYLPTTMATLMTKEQVASSLALKKAGHPSYEIIVPSITEENIGALLFYFELTTALMAELMGVNAYNQPGVEIQKQLTKAMIGTEGFESQKQELLNMLKNKEKYEI